MPVAAIAYALISAALFGASTPLAKLLLGELPPLLLAGLLYLGSGLGLLAWIALRPAAQRAVLAGSEWPRSEEHTSDSSHLVISYAVFCLKKKKKNHIYPTRYSACTRAPAGAA